MAADPKNSSYFILNRHSRSFLLVADQAILHALPCNFENQTWTLAYSNGGCALIPSTVPIYSLVVYRCRIAENYGLLLWPKSTVDCEQWSFEKTGIK